MKQLLSGKKIIKTFGVGEEKHRVLNEVSVTIGSGEFVSIMGPSGSGKSTLLYALSEMEVLTAGRWPLRGADCPVCQTMRCLIFAGTGWVLFSNSQPC